MAHRKYNYFTVSESSCLLTALSTVVFYLNLTNYPMLLLLLAAQSCPTLCSPRDCRPPGSSVHGILQARILEWVAMSSSAESSRPRDRTQVSCTAGTLYCLSHQGSPMMVSVVTNSLMQKNTKCRKINSICSSYSPRVFHLDQILVITWIVSPSVLS